MQQQADGSWNDQNPALPHGGVSALCTLALLNCGIEPDDDAMQRALEWLRRLHSDQTYVVSLQTMVFARAEPEKDLMSIRDNVAWLEKTQIGRRSRQPQQRQRLVFGSLDLSENDEPAPRWLRWSAATIPIRNLPCWRCTKPSRSACRPSNETWKRAKEYWERCQNHDGSWGYNRPNPNGTGSMTCAGITSLVIASDRVQSSDARVVRQPHRMLSAPQRQG